MISTSNVSMQFGEKLLFENISVKFQNGNCYGLVGANGCGKSVFMKILTKNIIPTSGNISVNNNKRIAVLSQDQFSFEKYRVIDTVIMGHTKLWEVKKTRDDIYSLAEINEQQGIKVAELEMQFAEMDGYVAESSASELLLNLDIPQERHDEPMSKIAPGWKLRVLLAQALFSNPDILLLDEPTNNLDINSIRWLENVLKQKKCTMVIISHDRHFLNSVCTHIADLDYGALNIFIGNYNDFMMTSVAIQEKMLKDNTKKELQIKELKHFVSRFSANASKSKQATSRLKQLDKIKLNKIKQSSRTSPYIIFTQGHKIYKNILELSKIQMSFDKQFVLKDINLMINSGDKVALIGPNGIGKTTLLRILIGEIKADDGLVKWSENANIGYFPQDNSHYFDKDVKVLEWMSRFKNADDDMQTVRSVLGKMLFSKENVNKSVQLLSGGEKCRLLFGKLMLQKANILVMDEPTNHLDMESIEALNLALKNYEGTLILVSHDRELVSSLSTKVIELKKDGAYYYSGNYEDYLSSSYG